MNSGFIDTTVANANVQMVFASGPFILGKGLRERFSMALLMGNDLNELLFHKQTVQQIYNANYNFSKPPLKPTLHAVAGDRRVYLYWDDIAEQSVDPFLGFQGGDPTKGYFQSFEGYTVYRSEEPQFEDDKLITDSQGEPTYYKPIAQFDLIDSIAGPDPVGINGARFWRGSNTGLQHTFVDTNVENGKTYFYAVCSYSKGDTAYDVINGVPTGLQPTECSKIITEDYSGSITFLDQNCAAVIPNAPVAGYVPPQIVGNLSKVTVGTGTGSLQPQVLDPGAVQTGAQYKIVFADTGKAPYYRTLTYDIIKTYSGTVDTLQANVNATVFGSNVLCVPFDGLAFTFTNDTSAAINDSLTNWYGSKSNYSLSVMRYPNGIAWPTDYQMEFYDHPVDTVSFVTATGSKKYSINYLITDLNTGQRVASIVADVDASHSLTIGDNIVLNQLKNPTDKTGVNTWEIEYRGPSNPADTPVPPQAGDKFMIYTLKPFANGDYFSFSTQAMTESKTQANIDLSKISVVPNPYISTASWEPRSIYPTGRGARMIDFIHLPAKCTIRIYTMSGALVKTLHKDDSNLDNGGEISWDLVTDDGVDVAYGIYIFHVDAPGIGNYIGKFAVIK